MLLHFIFISVVVCTAEISEFHSVFPPFLCLSLLLENLSAVSLDTCDNFSFPFQILVEVLRLLPADMFPRKTDEFPGGNRPRSSIELEMQKVAKKSISLPQSMRPLMKAVDCLKESLGASKVDDSFPMPPTITQDWVPS